MGVVLLPTKTTAVELGHLGTRVSALCPGFIHTPLNDASFIRGTGLVINGGQLAVM